MKHIGKKPLNQNKMKKENMDLKKELLEFLDAYNNFDIEEPEKIVDIYIEVCKEGKGINYFKQHELNKSE